MNQEKREKISLFWRKYSSLLILAMLIMGLGILVSTVISVNGDVLAGVPTSVLPISTADWTDQAILSPLPDTTPTVTELPPAESVVWLPLIMTSDTITQSRNITEDFNAHAILANCGTYLEKYGYDWNDAYNCEYQPFRGIIKVSAADLLLIAGRKHSSYTGNKIYRVFVEFPIPDDIDPSQVTGLRFCFNTQYWSPDTVYVHPGTWTPGLIAEIAQTSPGNLEDYYDMFFSPDVWNSRGDAFFIIQPLPSYHYGLSCTDVTIPVASPDDGFIRWVLRTADEDSPPEGTWGLSNYTFVDSTPTYTDIYLIYRP